jgi:hypothetical protein
VKKRLWFTALIPLLIIGLLLTGCPTAKTGSSTTIQDVQDEVGALGDAVSQNADDIADIDGRVSDLEDASSPDLSGYATGADLNNAFSSGTNIDRFLSNLTDAQITTLQEKLGIPSGGEETPTSGKVTLAIADSWGCDFEDTSLLNIYSNDSSASYRFTVEVTNGTAEYKYIRLNLSLDRDRLLSGTITEFDSSTKLSCLTYGTSLTYTSIPSVPTSGDTRTMLFTPSTRFPVGKGKTIEVDFNLDIMNKSGQAATWTGDLTYSVASSP